MTRAGSLLLDTVNEIVSECVIPEIRYRTKVKLSSLTIDPVLYGAAAIAIDHLLDFSAD